VLLGSVATAIDVLLGDVVWASADAEDFVELLSRQAWRPTAWLRPDPEDDPAVREVRSVLARFATGVMPDAEDAKFVLARVGVGT
jgi:predicted nicotinamide N-methyase